MEHPALKRILIYTGQEIYPATEVRESLEDGDVYAVEVADTIWQRYLSAAAEMEAVTLLLEDLQEVDHERRRCTAWHGELRCDGLERHSAEHWSWRSVTAGAGPTRWDSEDPVD